MKNYYFYFFFYNALIKWEGVLIFSDKQSEALCVIMYSLVEWFVTTLFLSLLKKNCPRNNDPRWSLLQQSFQFVFERNWWWN